MCPTNFLFMTSSNKCSIMCIQSRKLYQRMTGILCFYNAKQNVLEKNSEFEGSEEEQEIPKYSIFTVS